MHRVLSVLLAGLALALFISAPVLAEEKTETHSGTVVSVNGNQLRMLHSNGKEATHVLAPNAAVFCNGKACKLGDLKPGTPIRVTTPVNDLKTALRVEAKIAKPGGNPSQPPAQPQVRPPQAARPFLGIRAESAPGGVIVREVGPNGPAAQAGLMNGDLIQKVGKRPTPDFEALVNALAQHKPGDKVDFHFKRGNQEQDATVTLGRQSAFRPPEVPPQRATGFLGITTRDLSQEARNRLGIPPQRGALVVGVMADTPAAKAGLQNGDVIMSVNNKPVNGPGELRNAIQQAGAGNDILLKVQRGEQTRDFKAHLEESPAEFFFPR